MVETYVKYSKKKRLQMSYKLSYFGIHGGKPGLCIQASN